MNGLVLIAAWMGTAAVIALIAGWQPVLAWMNGNPNLAAWAQAVGSVIGLGIAVALPYYQLWDRRRQARLHARAFIASGRASIVGMRQAIAAKDHNHFKKLTHTLLVCKQLGDSLPMQDLSVRGMPELLAFRALVSIALEGAQRLLVAEGFTEDDVDSLAAMDADSLALAQRMWAQWPDDPRPE